MGYLDRKWATATRTLDGANGGARESTGEIQGSLHCAADDAAVAASVEMTFVCGSLVRTGKRQWQMANGKWQRQWQMANGNGKGKGKGNGKSWVGNGVHSHSSQIAR
jgi:hypothetical protein